MYRDRSYSLKSWPQTLFFAFAFVILLFIAQKTYPQETMGDTPPTFTLMGLGDSITEGGSAFSSYLFPLWEKLFAAGYIVEFVGPKYSPSRIGSMQHAGYSGQTAEYLEKNIDSLYTLYPADIVLLHSGHNHFADENPIEGIIAAQESIITKIKAINPNALIFVAQVIESGKLPKYSYIKELNLGIARLVAKLERSFTGVYLVDQASGFDWKTDAIEDRVHPNELGTEKMAQVWFNEIQKRVNPSAENFKPELVQYKEVSRTPLKLHIFLPNEQIETTTPRPCIVFFFGGGWKLGTPLQFYREATHYANQGLVAISADYRTQYTHGTTPSESIEDAKSAIRWIRAHAKEYNIDPNLIAVAGASAGGHLAAATGTISGFEGYGGNSLFSSRPNLNILYYPVLDIGPGGYGDTDLQANYQSISPIHNIGPQTPPTLILLGTEDPYLSEIQAESYRDKLEDFGQYCEIILYEGAGHPIFFYRKGLTPRYFEMLRATDRFLAEFGYLNKM